MTQQQIEGNKIIAEFSGYYKSPYPNTPNKMYHRVGDEERAIHIQNMLYHSSWDWLIPVINKFINENPLPLELRDLNQYREHCNALYNLITDFNITDVFNYFVKAIKWYNQQH